MTHCICRIYRVPSGSNAELRAQWIAAIKRHQHYNESLTAFNVCSRHFADSELFFRGKQKVLKLTAIPSIFNEANDNSSPDANFDNPNMESIRQTECENKCDLLQARVTELEKEIAIMKIQHDIEIQKIKIKSTNLRDSQSNKLKEARKEVSKQKTKLIRLEDVIKELREEHYISSEDAKFLSVSSKTKTTRMFFSSKGILNLIYLSPIYRLSK